MLELIIALTKLVTPDDSMKDVRLEKKQIRLNKKKLKLAKKMFKQIKKEFKKDGFTPDEFAKLAELREKIISLQESFI